MKKFICRCVWDFSEYFKIPLGRFAPMIFAGMIGCKGKEITKEQAE